MRGRETNPAAAAAKDRGERECVRSRPTAPRWTRSRFAHADVCMQGRPLCGCGCGCGSSASTRALLLLQTRLSLEAMSPSPLSLRCAHSSHFFFFFERRPFFLAPPNERQRARASPTCLHHHHGSQAHSHGSRGRRMAGVRRAGGAAARRRHRGRGGGGRALHDDVGVCGLAGGRPLGRDRPAAAARAVHSHADPPRGRPGQPRRGGCGLRGRPNSGARIGEEAASARARPLHLSRCVAWVWPGARFNTRRLHQPLAEAILRLSVSRRPE